MEEIAGGVEVGKVFVPLHPHTTSNFNLYLSFSSGWKLSVKMASTYCMVSDGRCWVCVPGHGGFLVLGGVSDDGAVLACNIMGEMKAPPCVYVLAMVLLQRVGQ